MPRCTARPCQEKLRVLVDQVVAWKEALTSGKVPKKDEETYAKAIRKNLEDIETLEKAMRQLRSHVLYPSQWLERPITEARWGRF
jgi:hypothetical protein